MAQGWSWSVRVEYDEYRGEIAEGTEEVILKGWAPTKEQASEEAEKAMERVRDNDGSKPQGSL